VQPGLFVYVPTALAEALLRLKYLHLRVAPCTHDQGIGADHLRALTGLPRLTKLNLYHLHWAEDAVELGLSWLAARQARLKILNAPSDVLVRPWWLLRGSVLI
jgi:hypothetical protein